MRPRAAADERAVRAFLGARGSQRVARLGSRERLAPERWRGDYGIPLRDELVLEKEVG